MRSDQESQKDRRSEEAKLQNDSNAENLNRGRYKTY